MLGSFARFAVFLLLIMGLATPAHAAKRVALVIGNGAYKHAAPLRNPQNDAEAVSAQLKALGFDVVTGINLTHRDFAIVLGRFRSKLEHADVALFFYAGHGLQVNGHNYLAPVEAKLDDEMSLSFEAVDLATVLALMERRRRTNIVFLDACRDNPLARNLARSMGTRSGAIGRGLARVESGVGTLITFATQPGNVALDGDEANSPFTKALVQHIATPGLDVALMMRRVRQNVIDATGGRQIPWQHSSLTAPFLFKAKAEPQPVQAAPAPQMPKFDRAAIDLAFWQSVKETDTREAYETYLERFPKGAFEPVAQLKLNAIKRSAAAQAEQQAQLAEAQRKQAEAAAAQRKAEAAKREKELAAAQRKLAEAEAAKRQAETAKREEELAELQRKQREEREKLAQERDALAKKLAEMEARAQARAEKEKAEVQVAALRKSDDAGETADTEPDPRALALALQTELKRVGCEPGKLDGQWGRKGRTALTRFNTHAKMELAIAEPSRETIDAIKEKKIRVCPVQVVKPKPVKKKPTQTAKKPSTRTSAKKKTDTSVRKSCEQMMKDRGQIGVAGGFC